MPRFLSTDEKISRLRSVLLDIAGFGGGNVKGILRKHNVPSYGLRNLAQEGFIRKTGNTSTCRYFAEDLSSIDNDTWILMAEVAFKPSPSNGRGKRDLVFESPSSPETIPNFPPVPVSEQIANYLAKLGELLSVQFNHQTPPGAYQAIHQLQARNRELEKKIYELEDTLKPFKKLAEKRFDKVEEGA